jgi:hypothetical protein
VSYVTLRLNFATLLCSFGSLRLRRIGETIRLPRRHADVMACMVLALLCQADHKIAIPTSVILMAFTSVVGIGTRLPTGSVQPGTFEKWLSSR